MENKKLVVEVATIINNLKDYLKVPIAVSNKHLHLTEQDFKRLFPRQANLTVKNWLNQPGEFAAEETVTLVGPRGQVENVRILGPFRRYSQVELSQTDCRQLGLKAPVRLSGDLAGATPIIVKTKTSEVLLPESTIVAKRHIHISEKEAQLFQLSQGQLVTISVQAGKRPLCFHECVIRIGHDFNLEMHVDTDEGNSAGLTSLSYGKIIAN